MSTKLTDPWSPTPSFVCDFSWYSPGGTLFPTLSYQVNDVHYPPADTTWTSGGVTYSTQYNTYTTATASGESSDAVVTTHSVDPVMFVVPLNQPVEFDAVDTYSLGIPKVYGGTPSLQVISYSWNLGNGVTGTGPTITTTYTYPQAPPDLAVTLTIVDSLGRELSTTKHITIEAVELLGGSENAVRSGAARP